MFQSVFADSFSSPPGKTPGNAKFSAQIDLVADHVAESVGWVWEMQ
jgi:hypothetical protein